MKDYIFFKSKFSEKHTIDNFEYLEKYIKLILEYRLCESDEYTEKHHILPKSVFPEFENEDWNIIELKYEDHINAHLFLFKSINIRQYQRPLNWMLNTYKNKEEISNASKIGWINLKMDSDKYSEWCRKRSDFMKKIPKEEQRRRANIFWDNISDEQYLNFSQKIKDHWTDEKRMEKSKQMNEYYLNPDNIIKKSIEGKKRWESMTEEEREKFNSKMDNINKDETKRKDAGFKIKELWKNKEYLEKMKNRKSNPGKKIKIIKPDGQEIIIDNMLKLERDYSISPHLIRKYRDKDIYIEEKDLKNNKLLLNCKIESI
jgi:hypothetical protein